MSRSSLCLGLAALMLAGCSPTLETVYVDVPRVMKAYEARPPDKPTAPSPPRPQPGESTSIPGQGARALVDRPRASGAEIRANIAEAQAQALRDIRLRLRRFYESDVARFEFDQQKLVTEAEMRAYEQANLRIRAEFEAYADKRGPILADLTLLSGFPDPNPTSRPPEDPLPPVLQERFERTVALRAALKTLDAEFAKQVQAVIDGVRDLASSTLANMRSAVEEYKVELDRRADAEANAQVRQSASELGLKLIEPLDLTLPATPGASVQIPGEAPFDPAPPVPSQAILRGSEDRERLIRHELGIWAGVKRYNVAGKPGARDATEEFLLWKQKYEIGR